MVLKDLAAQVTYKAGLMLHDFHHAMHQIGCDMKRRVYAEDGVI